MKTYSTTTTLILQIRWQRVKYKIWLIFLVSHLDVRIISRDCQNVTCSNNLFLLKGLDRYLRQMFMSMYVMIRKRVKIQIFLYQDCFPFSVNKYFVLTMRRHAIHVLWGALHFSFIKIISYNMINCTMITWFYTDLYLKMNVMTKLLNIINDTIWYIVHSRACYNSGSNYRAN